MSVYLSVSTLLILWWDLYHSKRHLSCYACFQTLFILFRQWCHRHINVCLHLAVFWLSKGPSPQAMSQAAFEAPFCFTNCMSWRTDIQEEGLSTTMLYGSRAVILKLLGKFTSYVSLCWGKNGYVWGAANVDVESCCFLCRGRNA